MRNRKSREYDPADTMRVYALRLYVAGMIKTSPQKILARSTDSEEGAEGITGQSGLPRSTPAGPRTGVMLLTP